jgi:hypothetical protein
MPTIEAKVRTERASRYLVQFCQHAAALGGAGGHRPRPHSPGAPGHGPVRVRADWSDTHGVVTFPPGARCTVDADANTLTVRVEAADEQALQRIRDIVTGDLGRFSRRDPLTVEWYQPAMLAGAMPDEPMPDGAMPDAAAGG